VLVFCAAGVILAGAAMRASIRRKRFGQTYFEFASLLFLRPHAEGVDSLALQQRCEAWHRLSLSCVRQVITAGVKIGPLSERSLASGRECAARIGHVWAGGGRGDPVEFSIRATPTSRITTIGTIRCSGFCTRRRTFRREFSDDFEVPVFRLTPSSASATEPAPIFPSDAQPNCPPPSNPILPTCPLLRTRKSHSLQGWTAAPNSISEPFATHPGIDFIRLHGRLDGHRLFPRHSKAPLLFTVCSDWLTCCCSTTYSCDAGLVRIRVENGKIVLRRALLGIGGHVNIPFRDNSDFAGH